ncbi:hypothetical protein [Celeribacter sp. ULVN23_4]
MGAALDEFFHGVIEPYIRDFEKNRKSLKCAYGAVWALDSYASHIFYHFRDSRNLPFTGDIDYKNKFLAVECDEFSIIMDISAATKHALRSTKRTSVASSSELQSVNLEGWAAYFAGADADDWGEQVIINNAHHLFSPLLPKVLRVETFLQTIKEGLEQG